MPYTAPTKKSRAFALKVCKMNFCNKTCKEYDFSMADPKREKEFYSKLKNGFQSSYSNEKIKKLKNRGALSNCVSVVDYDVYHK